MVLTIRNTLKNMKRTFFTPETGMLLSLSLNLIQDQILCRICFRSIDFDQYLLWFAYTYIDFGVGRALVFSQLPKFKPQPRQHQILIQFHT